MRFWDGQAAQFDDEPDHGLSDPLVREAWIGLLTATLADPPLRVADLGCGTGTLSVLLAERGDRVHGVDASKRMIQRARAKAALAGASPVFHVADATAPPLDRASWDVALSRHVLWALPDPAEALRMWVDLLAPGGRLVLIEGRWETGAGLGEAEIRALVEPLAPVVAVQPLLDPMLWGKEITDDRFMIVAGT